MHRRISRRTIISTGISPSCDRVRRAAPVRSLLSRSTILRSMSLACHRQKRICPARVRCAGRVGSGLCGSRNTGETVCTPGRRHTSAGRSRGLRLSLPFAVGLGARRQHRRSVCGGSVDQRMDALGNVLWCSVKFKRWPTTSGREQAKQPQGRRIARRSVTRPRPPVTANWQRC